MPDETRRRRADFRRGPSIRLADGQPWTFPDPAEVAAGRGAGVEPEFEALVRAVFEAEDRPDRLRCELALAINLLGRNYELTPVEYRRLLGFPPGSSELARAQAEFHALALDHAEYLWPVPEPTAVARPSGRGLLRGLSRLWAGRRPAAGTLAAPGGP
jgi:hypothetical protein